MKLPTSVIQGNNFNPANKKLTFDDAGKNVDLMQLINSGKATYVTINGKLYKNVGKGNPVTEEQLEEDRAAADEGATENNPDANAVAYIEDEIFPQKLELSDTELSTGYYAAIQYIEWLDDNGNTQIDYGVTWFKAKSNKPGAEAFKVYMDLNGDNNILKDITVENQTGKQYRKIKIDLTPCIEDNQELGNLKFDNAGTQIQIIPLDNDSNTDVSKNGNIKFADTRVVTTQDGYLTVSGSLMNTYKSNNKINTSFTSSPYIYARFDKPGYYQIRCRIANSNGVGGWASKIIYIREDKAPIVDLNIKPVTCEFDSVNNWWTTIRRTDDNLAATIYLESDTSIDVSDWENTGGEKVEHRDTFDTSSTNFEVRYDYNHDNDASNDGVHSSQKMYSNGITHGNIQNYLNVKFDTTFKNFVVRLSDSDKPILGKVRFEYYAVELPGIPIYSGGDLPVVKPMTGSSEKLPISQKLAFVDNTAPIVTPLMGKESKLDLYILQDGDTLGLDLQELIKAYGDKGNIYLQKGTGELELMN